MCRCHLNVCVFSGLHTFDSGDYWFIGGPLLLIAGIFEFILGNTFTYVVFISYGIIISYSATGTLG